MITHLAKTHTSVTVRGDLGAPVSAGERDCGSANQSVPLGSTLLLPGGPSTSSSRPEHRLLEWQLLCSSSTILPALTGLTAVQLGTTQQRLLRGRIAGRAHVPVRSFQGSMGDQFSRTPCRQQKTDLLSSLKYLQQQLQSAFPALLCKILA